MTSEMTWSWLVFDMLCYIQQNPSEVYAQAEEGIREKKKKKREKGKCKKALD